MKTSVPWKVHQAEFQRPVPVCWHWAVCYEPQSGSEEDAAGNLAFWEKEPKEFLFGLFDTFLGFGFFGPSCNILCNIVPGTISAVLDPRQEVSSSPYCGRWHGGIWCGWTSVHPFLPDSCFGIRVVLVPCNTQKMVSITNISIFCYFSDS